MFQSPRLLACLGAVALIVPIVTPALADPPRPPATQYVLISFDGAHELAQWRRSRALAKQTGARFTYFLSCVFLLSPESRKAYRAPGKAAGSSIVGFAASRDEVARRLYQLRLAVAEGNELASHGCGHFDGGNWSKADWLHEFSAFQTVLRDAYRLNDLGEAPAGWDRIASSVRGFRAPYLSTNKALYTALAKDGFAYDASGVSQGPVVPDLGQSPARFALPQIPEGPKQRRVIAMDYNLFVRHSGGFERADKDRAFENRTLAAFRNAFRAEYDGPRRPLQLGFHFTLMNSAAYWRALERFATETCGKPSVACVTYGEYLKRTAKGHHAGG